MTAGSLLKLREWLTLDEAASELSTMLGENVSEADVLRLALEGHLKLSVNLPAGANAMCFANDAEKQPTLRRHIDGLWELPMIGAGRRQAEHEFNYLRGLPFISMERTAGAIVEREGVRCQLPADRGSTGFSTRPESALPQGSMIVVRRGALDECAALISEPSAAATESTTTSLPILTEAGQQGTDAYLPQADQEAATPDLRTTEGRRAAVDRWLEKVNESGLMTNEVRRADFWRAADYKSATDFNRWQRCDPLTTKRADEKFRNLLSMTPADFSSLR